jgi:hypothetical protein
VTRACGLQNNQTSPNKTNRSKINVVKGFPCPLVEVFWKPSHVLTKRAHGARKRKMVWPCPCSESSIPAIFQSERCITSIRKRQQQLRDASSTFLFLSNTTQLEKEEHTRLQLQPCRSRHPLNNRSGNKNVGSIVLFTRLGGAYQRIE